MDAWTARILAAYVAAAAASEAGATCAGRLSGTAAWSVEGDAVASSLGLSVAGAGDIDGDGYAEIVVGLPGWNPGCPSACQNGAVYVYRGSATGPSPAPEWSFLGPGFGSGFGAGVGAAGDVDGDGYGDLIFAGSFHADEPQQVQLHRGSPDGLASEPAWTYVLGPAYTVWPLPSTAAGDVDGDGYDDVIVGWRRWPGYQADMGRALVFAGSPAGLSASPVWSVEGAAYGANVGFSVASAGDVNGDDLDDVLVASSLEVRLYPGRPSGPAATPSWTAPIDPRVDIAESYGGAASAGDVNGDGYDDVIVGSPAYSNGETNEGRVEVYHGSAAGLAATPARSVESDVADAFFGCSVAPAGDVDCDGYADVVVGACFEGGTGRSYIFPGGPAGLSPTAGWTASGGAANALFGRSVAAAGDVNGDGRADVIVGAPGVEPAGQAFVYLGVPPASSGAAAATPDGSDEAQPPLALGKDPRGTLTLTWGVSCLANEMDWEIYVGALGDFANRQPATCSTGGQTAARLGPPSGDAYYLVVPRTSDREGSHGKDGGGAERPPGAAPCLPREIAACP